jgi:hypothetical protein
MSERLGIEVRVKGLRGKGKIMHRRVSKIAIQQLLPSVDRLVARGKKKPYNNSSPRSMVTFLQPGNEGRVSTITGRTVFGFFCLIFFTGAFCARIFKCRTFIRTALWPGGHIRNLTCSKGG